MFTDLDRLSRMIKTNIVSKLRIQGDPLKKSCSVQVRNSEHQNNRPDSYGPVGIDRPEFAPYLAPRPFAFGPSFEERGNLVGPQNPGFFGGMGGLVGGPRFDPIGPSGIVPRPGYHRPHIGPDNDIFRPPGQDDMFL